MTHAMFGFFDLAPASSLADFKQAFDALCVHLHGHGSILSWRLMERAHHNGYDADFPNRDVMVEITFKDRAAADESWDYIESGDDGLRALHLAVNRQVRQSMFILYKGVEDEK